MKYLEDLSQIAAENGGIITNKSAEEQNISRSILCKYSKEGNLQRIAQGQYVLSEGLPDELLSLSVRSSNLILSHETALWLHGISDRTPFFHSVTAPSGKMPSKSIQTECKVYYVKPDLFELGKTEILSPSGNMVTVYNLERTICDCVRSRNRMEKETFLAALKNYVLRKDKNLNLLFSYSEKFHISSIMYQYMEVLL